VIVLGRAEAGLLLQPVRAAPNSIAQDCSLTEALLSHEGAGEVGMVAVDSRIEDGDDHAVAHVAGPVSLIRSDQLETLGECACARLVRSNGQHVRRRFQSRKLRSVQPCRERGDHLEAVETTPLALGESLQRVLLDLGDALRPGLPCRRGGKVEHDQGIGRAVSGYLLPDLGRDACSGGRNLHGCEVRDDR
jgi:hypothetical protein